LAAPYCPVRGQARFTLPVRAQEHLTLPVRGQARFTLPVRAQEHLTLPVRGQARFTYSSLRRSTGTSRVSVASSPIASHYGTPRSDRFRFDLILSKIPLWPQKSGTSSFTYYKRKLDICPTINLLFKNWFSALKNKTG